MHCWLLFLIFSFWNMLLIICGHPVYIETQKKGRGRKKKTKHTHTHTHTQRKDRRKSRNWNVRMWEYKIYISYKIHYGLINIQFPLPLHHHLLLEDMTTSYSSEYMKQPSIPTNTPSTRDPPDSGISYLQLLLCHLPQSFSRKPAYQ